VRLFPGIDASNPPAFAWFFFISLGESGSRVAPTRSRGDRSATMSSAWSINYRIHSHASLPAKCSGMVGRSYRT